jgi:hypothetical protein
MNAVLQKKEFARISLLEIEHRKSEIGDFGMRKGDEKKIAVRKKKFSMLRWRDANRKFPRKRRTVFTTEFAENHKEIEDD